MVMRLAYVTHFITWGAFHLICRRGGPRRSTKNDKEVRRMSVSRSSISSSHPSTSGTVVDLPQCSSVSGTGDTNSAQETDPSLRHIIGLLTPFSGEQSLSVDPGLLWGPQDTEPPSEIENPVLRVYTSEKDILALSAILCLIPPPQDPQPSGECHVWMRRAYARLYAQAALSIAEKEIDELVSPNNLTSYAEDDRLHNELPFQLYPVLALVALSIYEYCQCGNVSRMRTRANQAITTAMDLGLHRSDTNAPEAHRRAWWSASPIITANDPRITTPFPKFKACVDGPEPWPLLLKAQEAYISVSDLLGALGLVYKAPTQSLELRDQIYQLDSRIMSLATESEFYMGLTCKDDAEGVAMQGMGLIAYLLLHSAWIRLHRFRAFMDIPLFVEKHCDLTAINDKAPYPEVSSNFEAVFPFTEQQSSVRCLKSSLSVARAFRNLPRPQPSRSTGGSGNHHSPAAGSLDIPSAVSSTTLGATSPSALPYFKCTAMQASYSMFMLVHRIRAAIASNRLSVCYPLMASPEPATEIQDARRLIEELRHAIECLKHSMERDMVFEGIAAMCRGLTAVYLSVFQTDYFEQEVSCPPARQER
ncbi:hypothetical protein BDV30DRAFT_224749 [Aspergillus minisclerotigenes]|uniref:Transcription factor domain-containing protein n=1 Tax=Aspergillus minisclerotigenes TaxID=656917 RepID=A0A5N6JAU4_9EURO|nr:hypothetical protein BDV30DRAFT_224749 [Aspergillus minisclerotigenes]